MATHQAPLGPMPLSVPAASAAASSTANPDREVLRCEGCKLVQFRSPTNTCKRCKRSLIQELPKAQPTLALATQRDTAPAATAERDTLQVATAVRDLRRVRNLSQRQLAARMGVPRTYISKIENAKAMPTLNSLDRLAKALQVDISALLRDAPTRHQDETAMLTADPFLAEVARYASSLTATQKSIFLNHVREMAQVKARRSA